MIYENVSCATLDEESKTQLFSNIFSNALKPQSAGIFEQNKHLDKSFAGGG